MALTNVEEFAGGGKVFKITAVEMAKTPVSGLLCSNFIELGFGYQVEGMWGEMLYNRSFEESRQLLPAAYDWYGGEGVVGGDWREQEWYHSGYSHDRWYACPAEDRPPSVAPDSTYIVQKAPFYSLTVTREKGGVHGESCLVVHNFEQERMCGVAQNGKYLRRGQNYRFRGWFQPLGEAEVSAEIRFYATEGGIDWESPLAVLELGALPKGGGILAAELKNPDFEGWAAFSLFITPGKAMLDAFSLMPEHTSNGWRTDVVEGLKRVNPKLLRYPGGCFASLHDWRDAVGPMDTRKPEPSYFWGDLNYNDVGTDEFLRLCGELNCEAMLVVNMFHPDKRYYLANGINDAEHLEKRPHGYDLPRYADMEEGIRCAAQWVEYCNGDVSTAMGAKRAENGHPEPYNVKYWEMDNETFRWFTHIEYAEAVVKYSEAMKAADPSVMIGLCSYHHYKTPPLLKEMLEICGEHVDFLADRVCEPDNLKYKLDIVREYNAGHKNKIFYADTEALQNRDPEMAPFVKAFYKDNGITIREARRTWIYALSLASNLMMDQRYGGEVRFMCFNNLANTTGQSCIETPKEQVVLPACGLIYERMSRSEAAWPLVIEGYEPCSRKEIEIQAAWNPDRDALVIYLLNRCDADTSVSLDISGLGRDFSTLVSRRMSADGGRVQETVKSQGNIDLRYEYGAVEPKSPFTREIPRFSFTEITVR